MNKNGLGYLNFLTKVQKFKGIIDQQLEKQKALTIKIKRENNVIIYRYHKHNHFINMIQNSDFKALYSVLKNSYNLEPISLDNSLQIKLNDLLTILINSDNEDDYIWFEQEINDNKKIAKQMIKTRNNN